MARLVCGCVAKTREGLPCKLCSQMRNLSVMCDCKNQDILYFVYTDLEYVAELPSTDSFPHFRKDIIENANVNNIGL